MDKYQNNKEKVVEIERIYKEYLDQMNELKKAQNKLIDDYIYKLEEKKKEEIMKKFD
ncbi:MAG: hypothetical protein US30_C0008G0044 [Candidatus Moranbacteria bacterium GW2011_GWF2_36_839]|nr:MAG: hypothetical protein US27_C0008G0044 [Candidatus Moranbacteria bacterium GW2011_GWF1_36_78]KKQ17026.1 MAG: hypothetical protein US30_C0008G0044 [Candidatus Moranbacteria bacterium GW2011_GWF2_36_839]